MDANQTEGGKNCIQTNRKIENKQRRQMGHKIQFAASFAGSHPAAKIEHSGVENCETLTLEILFSHFEMGRGYNLKPGTIFTSKNIGDQTPGGCWTVISPQLAKCPPADVLIHISLPPPPCPLKVHSSTSVCFAVHKYPLRERGGKCMHTNLQKCT